MKLQRAIAAAGLSAGASLLGHRAGALTGGGAAAALAVGTAIGAGSGWRGMVSLAAFFLSSSGLSRRQRGRDIAAKGATRDQWQVLANGGAAAVASLLSSASPERAAYLAAGSLAAAAADTWATEIGSRAPVVPRLVLSGHPAARGTSGAVSREGLLASVAGAGLVAGVTLTSGLVARSCRSAPLASLGVFIAGICGSLTDSVLGELVQERRRCPNCEVITERAVHHCGTATTFAGGIRGFDNDAVNFACTLVGALAMLPYLPRRS